MKLRLQMWSLYVRKSSFWVNWDSQDKYGQWYWMGCACLLLNWTPNCGCGWTGQLPGLSVGCICAYVGWRVFLLLCKGVTKSSKVKQVQNNSLFYLNINAAKSSRCSVDLSASLGSCLFICSQNKHCGVNCRASGSSLEEVNLPEHPPPWNCSLSPTVVMCVQKENGYSEYV